MSSRMGTDPAKLLKPRSMSEAIREREAAKQKFAEIGEQIKQLNKLRNGWDRRRMECSEAIERFAGAEN